MGSSGIVPVCFLFVIIFLLYCKTLRQNWVGSSGDVPICCLIVRIFLYYIEKRDGFVGYRTSLLSFCHKNCYIEKCLRPNLVGSSGIISLSCHLNKTNLHPIYITEDKWHYHFKWLPSNLITLKNLLNILETISLYYQL